MNVITAYFYLALQNPTRFMAVCEEFGVPPEALEAMYIIKLFADSLPDKESK